MRSSRVERMLRFPVLAMLACVSAASAKSSEPFSGNDLYHACEAREDQSLSSFCIGYVIGTWDGMVIGAVSAFYGASSKGASVDDINLIWPLVLGVCQPAGVTNEQIKDIFVKYLSEHPENRQVPARFLLLDAMREAFPCQPSAAPPADWSQFPLVRPSN